MNRDSLKTIGAVVLIAAIVGLTFWYGNKQRNDQVKSDQAQQQQLKQKTTTSQSTAKPAQVAVTPTPQPAMPASTPQTGADTAIILPLGALVAAVAVKRASDRSLKRSLLLS